MTIEAAQKKKKAYMRYVRQYLIEHPTILQEKGFNSFDSFVKEETNFKQFREDSTRVFYNAFNKDTAPIEKTLNEISQAFKIPLAFKVFCTELDSQNPEFVKFYNELDRSIPPDEAMQLSEAAVDNLTVSPKNKFKRPLIFLSCLLALTICSFLYLKNKNQLRKTASVSHNVFDISRESYNVLLFPFQPLEK